LKSLATFAGSWVIPGGEVAVVPSWAAGILPASSSTESGLEACESSNSHTIGASFPGNVVFEGLGRIKITASDATWAIVDLTNARSIPDVVDAINAAPINVVAVLYENGNGYSLIDFTEGPGELKVESVDSLPTARILKLARQSQADGTDGSSQSCDGNDDSENDNVP
jgi:hypothetical protein